MQKQKNITLTITLGILLAITAGVYWYGARSATPINKARFQVKAPKEIDHVTFTSPLDTVQLDFDGARWRVNDSLRADRQMVDVLFATLQQAEAKRPVASSLRDSVAQWLQAHGVRVVLYAGESRVQEILAGGNAAKTEAWFMSPDDQVPYVMTIPGYRVYVSGILELDTYGWRDKYVFGFNWRNFNALRAEFPNAADNYVIRMDAKNHTVSVAGMAAVDTARLNTFLDDVSLLRVDQYSHMATDSLQAHDRVMTLIVEDVGNRQYTLALYGPTAGATSPGVVGGTQPAIFESSKIRKIIRPRSYFMPK